MSKSLFFKKRSRTCSDLRESSLTNLVKIPLGFPYLQGMMEVRSGTLVYKYSASSVPIRDPEKI